MDWFAGAFVMALAFIMKVFRDHAKFCPTFVRRVMSGKSVQNLYRFLIVSRGLLNMARC